MSTGRRLAKRSIIGTRVCAPGDDAKFYSGVIQAVKTPAKIAGSNSIDLTPNTIYTVRFDSRQGESSGVVRITGEFAAKDLIGPGFGSVLGVELVAGQKCFVTYNGREVSGEVCKHYAETDEVIISIQPNGFEAPLEVQKRLEEVRLLESRKSARLADQDTDFARLADMACDRKKTASHVIDVPVPPFPNGSRKRRTSSSNYSNYSNYDDNSEDELIMDECRAALVLMSLSCSPLTSDCTAFYFAYPSPESSSSSSSSSSSDSSTFSYRSTPSPTPTPLGYSVHTISISSSFNSDEGIGMDYPEYPDEVPRKKRNLTRMIFQCTWPHCYHKTDTCDSIEAHIRRCHLKTQVLQFAEEEFYFTEVEYGNMASSPPTLSHQDMARPFHEDPDYQRLLVGNIRQSLLNQQQQQPLSPQPQNKAKLSPRPNSPKTPVLPRRVRSENKKCRKVYGMEHKEQWCTQCKWKKACTRFAE